jgi:MFS family permease
MPQAAPTGEVAGADLGREGDQSATAAPNVAVTGKAASRAATGAIASPPAASAVFETDIPARLDRLPWSRFHWLVITALGIAWILDGLEVTIVGSLAGALTESPSLHLTAQQVGWAASAYLVGAVAGALFFGWLTDRLGRKKLFTVTVLVYLVATIACGFSWNFASFALFRLITGAGIGGEYAAVNATIQELIPARRRGFTDLVVNGSFWIGAAVGALGAYVVLDPAIMPPEIGWRAAFLIGGLLGFIVLLLRRFLPESPRWLMTHGQPEEAARVVAQIEARVERETGRPLPPVPPQRLRLRSDVRSWFAVGARTVFTLYRGRAVLGISLMAAQAFCYNAVFFTYALVLTRFYGVSSGDVGLFLLPFAIGNFLGPLLLGRLFDTLGRRVMITATYAISGVLMALTGWLFALGVLNAVHQTMAWTVIFFFASAAASSAYLTVGESFPLEVRAIAIALFYAFGTGVGGVAAPALFGALIDTGSRYSIFAGYLLGGALMVGAAGVAFALGVDAERRSLEDVAPPLSAVA